MTTLQEVSRVAQEVVRAAGAMIRTAFHDPQRPAYSLKGRQDYLTATDGAVEAYVKQAIARHFPEDAVMGEETGGVTEAPRLWIVDPIDGQVGVNLSLGYPLAPACPIF